MDGVTSGLQDLSLNQKPVYLLKTRSSPTDGYEDYFEQLGDGKYKPIFVPVLDHMFRPDALRKLRLAAERFAFGPGSEESGLRKATDNLAKKYGGIVFTSQRAVDAFATVIAKLEPSKIEAMFDKDMPLYVVGPATATSVRALGLPCQVVGEQTGNGEALANFILEWHRTVPPEATHLNGRKLPLLFLVGEQRRDIIPKTLQSEELPEIARVPIVEVIIYETGEMVTFEEDFTNLLREAKVAKVKEQWVVVFSPQGCEAMLNALRWLDTSGQFNPGMREIVSESQKTFIATIGPTTKDFLVQELGFEPDVCAATPSAEGLGEGMEALDG